MTSRATVAPDDRFRLFCALQLPDDVVSSLVSWQSSTLAGAEARIVPPDHLHVTLAFLGSRPAADVDAIAEVVQRVARNARVPLLRVRRYRETQRVGMLVLEEELVPGDTYVGRAQELAGALMQQLEERGVYKRERRGWMPHLTVARFRVPPKLSLEPPRLAAFSPSGVALYSSVLHPTGSRYRVLESCSLGIGESGG